MLRVESNTDIRGFTEFEEEILFDEDDPDFDHKVPAISVPFIFRESKHIESRYIFQLILVAPDVRQFFDRYKGTDYLTMKIYLALEPLFKIMVTKYKTIYNACKQLYLIGYQRFRRKTANAVLAFPLLSFSFLWIDPYSLYDRWIKSKYQTKTDLYWMKMSTKDIVEEADKLYEDGDYLKVYEVLNRIKYNGNPEVQWRICRALFRMSVDPTFNPEMREEMISEAYILINLALTLEQNNPNIYKWLAIITDAKCALDGLVAKIESFELMKGHLEKALELQPDDMATLYILGKWCYEMSRLTRFQRLIARTLYAEPPRSTYQEAYDYLVRAAEIRNNDYYIPIFYVLGKTCLKMKQFFRARYYLSVATTLQARSQYEKYCVRRARYLLVRLGKYDLDKDSILNNLQYTDNYNV